MKDDILNWFCESGRYDYNRLDEVYCWLSGTPEERRDKISQWGYGLDYKKFNQPCCWITREGAVYTVHWAGHARFMQDIGLSERWAEDQGWVKVTVSGVYHTQRPSPKQYRILKELGLEYDAFSA